MQTYQVVIPATYTITVEAEDVDLALFIGKNTIDQSRIYHKGGECEDGQVWLGDIDDVYVLDED